MPTQKELRDEARESTPHIDPYIKVPVQASHEGVNVGVFSRFWTLDGIACSVISSEGKCYPILEKDLVYDPEDAERPPVVTSPHLEIPEDQHPYRRWSDKH